MMVLQQLKKKKKKEKKKKDTVEWVLDGGAGRRGGVGVGVGGGMREIKLRFSLKLI